MKILKKLFKREKKFIVDFEITCKTFKIPYYKSLIKEK